MSPMWFDPGTSCIVIHHSINGAKEISTNAVRRVGYEATTVPITLGRGALNTVMVPEIDHHSAYRKWK